ncbi:MAG: hypothetical protein ABIK96_00475 [bacterium]
MLRQEQIEQMERQLQERGQALTSLTTRLEGQISAKRERLAVEMKKRLSEADSGEERGAIRAVMGKSTEGQLSELRRKLVTESEGRRTGILALLQEYEANIEATRELYASPIQVLSRQGLGTPERTQYQQQLAGAGPAELASTAKLATTTGDRVLAAAVLVTADRDRKKYQQFDRAGFAESVVGQEVARMRGQLDALALGIKSMRVVNRSFEQGRSHPTDKIELGLAKRRLAHE